MQRDTVPVFSAVELEHLRLQVSSRQQATTPCGLVLSLVGEVGDLAKLFAWRSSGAASQAPLTAQDKADVGQELSAALLQLVRIADACGVDLGRAALDTLAAPAATQSGPKGHPAVRPVASVPGSQPQQQQQQPGLHSAPEQPFVPPRALQTPQQQQPKPPPPPLQQQQQQQQQQAGVQFGAPRQHWEQRSGPAGPQQQGLTAAPLPTPGTAAAGGTSAGTAPSSSSVTSISVGLLRQLATLAALNPQAAIDLLTANPAATASLVAAITDPSHPVARVVAAALSQPGSTEAAAGSAGRTPAGARQAGGRPAASPASPGQPPQITPAGLASASALQQQLGSRLAAGVSETQQHSQLGGGAAAAAAVGVPATPPAGSHTAAGVAAAAGASPTAQLQQQPVRLQQQQPVQLQQQPVRLQQQQPVQRQQLQQQQQQHRGGHALQIQHQQLNAQQLRVLAQHACEQGWTSSQAEELAASLGIDAGVLRAVIEGVAAGSAGGSGGGGGGGAAPGRGRGQAAAAGAQPRGVKRGLYMG